MCRGFESRQERQEIFFFFFSSSSSPGSTCCADFYFGVRSTPVLPQQHEHVKDPCHSAKSAGDRLQLNT